MIKKKTFCCSDQIYSISSKFLYFFRCIQLCVFSEVHKAPTFFYIKFLTYKHKPPINPLTMFDREISLWAAPYEPLIIFFFGNL